MARPRSEDKRNAILAAATRLMAEQGIAAPTAQVARQAGVAEGTLFTYFASKDILLNELYLSVKESMRLAMMVDYPVDAPLEERARHAWETHLAWGVAHPQARRVMAQLSMSERVGADVKAAGAEAFRAVHDVLREAVAGGPLERHPLGYAAAMMGTLAETTMDFIEQQPADAATYRDTGFRAFWRALTVR